jgi:hypothetical protein
MSQATTSAAKQGIRVRAIEETQEMSVCVELQRRNWGYAPIDTVPDQIFIVAKKTGGQVITAYFTGARPVHCMPGCLRTALWGARNGFKRCSPACCGRRVRIVNGLAFRPR